MRRERGGLFECGFGGLEVEEVVELLDGWKGDGCGVCFFAVRR
jgi:hypothetical protein